MERDGWLMALVVVIAMAAPFSLLVLVLATGLGLDTGQGLPRSGPRIEVALNPLRAALGVGTALVLVGAAVWIIRRTDWSGED
jgi:hypothetical protein